MKRSPGSSKSIAAGSAERPDHFASDPENKRQKRAPEEELLTIVAYISFPLKNYNAKAQHRSAMELIRQAKQTGAEVINIAFARSMDIAALWHDLEKQMESSVEQPALSYRAKGPLITRFSENFAELVT